MADSMIFHRLSDNANDIGREVVRKAVKAILAETDADVITIKRADRDRIAMIECYVGGGEFYLVVTPDNKISMRLVTDIPGSSSSTYAITTIERDAKNSKKIRAAVRKIVTEDRVTRYLYSCLSSSETGTSEIGFKEIASEDNSTKKVYVSVRAVGKKRTPNCHLQSHRSFIIP